MRHYLAERVGGWAADNSWVASERVEREFSLLQEIRGENSRGALGIERTFHVGDEIVAREQGLQFLQLRVRPFMSDETLPDGMNRDAYHLGPHQVRNQERFGVQGIAEAQAQLHVIKRLICLI